MHKLSNHAVEIAYNELRPLEKVNVAEAVQERLMQFIQHGKLVAGDKLPSESTLTESLGVSRVALREALHSMQALGVIVARVGSGWYVKEFSVDSMASGLFQMMKLNPDLVYDVEEIQMYLECSLIDEAMRTLTPEDIASLDHEISEMERLASIDEDGFIHDYTFHKNLFSRIDNPMFHVLSEVFWMLYGFL